MRQPRRLASRAIPARRGFLAVALASLLLPMAAGTALGKEGLLVALDAPIGMDTPPGTELLVGMTVTALDGDGEHPVYGSPIVLVLTGRDGSETEAHGVEDRPGSGHYVMRIPVPPGGARDARVVMRGMSNDGPSDIELIITNDPLTFGGVTARTAQVAPAPTPALTPVPRATAAAGDAANPAAGANPAAAANPTAAPEPDPGASWIPAIGLVALGLAVVIGVRLGARRRSAQGT